MNFVNDRMVLSRGEKGIIIALLLVVLALAILLLGIRVPSALGWDGLWDASSQYSDKESVTVSWDKPVDPCPLGMTCGVEVELRLLEDKETVINKCTVTGLDNLTCTLKYKESGHWKGYIRVWNSADMVAFTYSDWANSFTNGAVLLNGITTPRGWVLYWRIPPASDGEIH